MAPIYLGEFEYAILLAILHLDEATEGTESADGAYAVPIRELIEQRTTRPVARGALYTGLDRLESKGCLKSRMGDPSEERGGKARRYYSVTPAGLKAIRATHDALSSMDKGLESILADR